MPPRERMAGDAHRPERYATPPSTLAGRLSVAVADLRLGEGTFLAGSAVFFTLVVGLSLGEVGIGLTIAAIASFVVAVPMGKLVDHFGPKRMWSLSAVLQGALFAVWPFIDSFPGYVAMAVVMEVVGDPGRHGPRRLRHRRAAPRGAGRVAGLHVLRAQRRLQPRRGCIGVVAIAFGTDALRWATGAERRAVPGQQRQRSCGCPTPRTTCAATSRARSRRASPRSATAAGSPSPPSPASLWTNQVLLHTVIPLWLVTETDAPRVLVALLFGTNTLMCIVLPRLASRGIQDIGTALRAMRLSTVFFVLTCVITLSTHETVGLGDDRAVLPRPRRPHLGRALPLRLRLDPRGRADGPAPPRRIPGRLRARRHARAGSGRRRSTASSRWSGAPSAG